MLLNWLIKQQYSIGWAQLFLRPFSWLFAVIVAIRRWAYQQGYLQQSHLAVPVIVVGNIQVGGTGKTPFTLYLAHALQSAGWHPVIISRGYPLQIHPPMQVSAAHPASEVGDEPCLLAKRSGVPVWVGRQRLACAQAALQAHPDCRVILSDDGLQHYALGRDIECVVIDATRGWGNQTLLPAGPLREPLSRLKHSQALILHGTSNLQSLPANIAQFSMQLQPSTLVYSIDDTKHTLLIQDLIGKKIAAVAGIGHPERFFKTLRQLGLHCSEHAFPDHYDFSATDLNLAAEIILVTEKDAVKCQGLNHGKIYALAVDAVIHPNLLDWLIPQLTHAKEAI